MTKDGITLRGYRFEYETKQTSFQQVHSSRPRLIQYMHGTRVYLPNKIPYLTEKSIELKASIVAFAYRGFS